MTAARVDLVIFGGGIAGLWLLARLRGLGYSAVLFEADVLGGGQSVASQGIIHGGAKYALDAKIGGTAEAIAAMPGRWRAALDGVGDIDLSGARLASANQHLWLPPGPTARLKGFFASAAMQSRMTRLDRSDWPNAFPAGRFRGEIYRLDEPVVDVPSVVAELAKGHADAIFALGNPDAVAIEADRVRLGETEIACDQVIYAAGAGNRARTSAVQTRPLHMLMVKGVPWSLFAHCAGTGVRPRLTVTSHEAADGGLVWYLGGEIAERGVEQTEAELIAAGRRELGSLLPWLDQTELRWAGYRIDRSEPKHGLGRLPNEPRIETRDGVMVAWPVKLAFAPRLADAVVESLAARGIAPSPGDIAALTGWPRPPLGQPPWEAVTWT